MKNLCIWEYNYIVKAECVNLNLVEQRRDMYIMVSIPLGVNIYLFLCSLVYMLTRIYNLYTWECGCLKTL